MGNAYNKILRKVKKKNLKMHGVIFYLSKGRKEKGLTGSTKNVNSGCKNVNFG